MNRRQKQVMRARYKRLCRSRVPHTRIRAKYIRWYMARAA